MIQLLLHESDPRNQPKMTEFWTPVGRWGDHFLSGRLSTRKGGVLLHFNHIATVSTRWRAQNLFESLTFTSRYMYRLVTEIHQIRRLGTAFGEPSVISTTRPHAKQ